MAYSNLVEIVVVAFALLGSILNARAMRSGFYFWLIANIAGAALFFEKQLFGMGVLYVIYACICIYGLQRWEKLP